LTDFAIKIKKNKTQGGMSDDENRNFGLDPGLGQNLSQKRQG
jgi:hypothetical protein